MTITEIIENIESTSQDIEDMTQIPLNLRNALTNKLDEVNSVLENALDSYGDDPDDYSDEDGDISED